MYHSTVSYLILSYPIPSHPIPSLPSYPILSYPILSYLSPFSTMQTHCKLYYHLSCGYFLVGGRQDLRMGGQSLSLITCDGLRLLLTSGSELSRLLSLRYRNFCGSGKLRKSMRRLLHLLRRLLFLARLLLLCLLLLLLLLLSLKEKTVFVHGDTELVILCTPRSNVKRMLENEEMAGKCLPKQCGKEKRLGQANG